MSYQSIPFLIFTLVVLVLYYALGRKVQKWVLLLANLAFLYATGWMHIPFLLVSLTVSYLVGRKMGSIYDAADAQLAACQDKTEKKQIRADSKKNAKKFLIAGLIAVIGMLVLIKAAGLNPAAPVEKVPAAQLKKVFHLCKGLEFHIAGHNGFENAQVCGGGVDLREVTQDMESLKVPGVFFAGEILDVDGRCGGYNLQWAWTSGVIAGRGVCK